MLKNKTLDLEDVFVQFVQYSCAHVHIILLVISMPLILQSRWAAAEQFISVNHSNPHFSHFPPSCFFTYNRFWCRTYSWPHIWNGSAQTVIDEEKCYFPL